MFETKHAAHRFIGKLAAAKLACDNAASREEKVRVYERYKVSNRPHTIIIKVTALVISLPREPR